MTKNEAIRSIRLLTSGTIAHFIGCNKYERIDAAYCDWILRAASMPEDAFQDCQNWMDVLALVR